MQAFGLFDKEFSENFLLDGEVLTHKQNFVTNITKKGNEKQEANKDLMLTL